mmetsp:Transcript_57581/g.122460  ORF Transcript_57581/g.122460 Transcript_57581/m.122460 type:complete len:441 (-) Transcript_57581:37-1359(-)
MAWYGGGGYRGGGGGGYGGQKRKFEDVGGDNQFGAWNGRGYGGKAWHNKGAGKGGCGGPLGLGPVPVPPPSGLPFGTTLPPPPGMLPFSAPAGEALNLPTLPPASGPARQVFLAPATAQIVVEQPRPIDSKQIALEFIRAPKARQEEMLQDPAVSKAILQTLSESSGMGGMGGLGGGLGGGLPSMPSMMGATMPIGMPSLPEKAPLLEGATVPAWTGTMTVSRNKSKKMPTRAAILHGKIQDVEVALRSAASNQNVFDITHRVPFDDVARKISTSTVLSLMAGSPAEMVPMDEYVKYFRSKMRAGVVRLTDSLSMYVLPASQDIPILQEHLYSLGGHIPRTGCLIAVIAPGSAPAPAAPAQAPRAEVKTKSSAPPAEAPVAAPVDTGAPAEAPAAAAAEAPVEDPQPGRGSGGLSGAELMDLFSNPELIKFFAADEEEGS